MVFTDIRLQNYRSYKDASFDLDGGVTIIVGPNAAGKSNLVEALLLAANTTSYRGKAGLLRHGAPWARLDVHTAANTTRTIKINTDENGKTRLEYVTNEKTYKRLPFQQRQPAVLFEPNNLLLMHGEPQARREYLDTLSSQLEDSYAGVMSRYKRTLAQRNALLKAPYLDKKQLFVWDLRLSELADNIVRQRTSLIDLINQRLSDAYSQISGKKSSLVATYKPIVTGGNYSAGMMKKLEKDLEFDLARGFTGTGPHREDFLITLNQKPIEVTASRGETRTLLLTLKIIEMELLEQKTAAKPLLLLDDVFSELDNSRRQALTKYLQKYQTIITTTDADIITKNFSQAAQLISI